jgi:hypothetical protein
VYSWTGIESESDPSESLSSVAVERGILYEHSKYARDVRLTIRVDRRSVQPQRGIFHVIVVVFECLQSTHYTFDKCHVQASSNVVQDDVPQTQIR